MPGHFVRWGGIGETDAAAEMGAAVERPDQRHTFGTVCRHLRTSQGVATGQRTPNPLAVGTFHAHGRTVPSQPLCGMSLGLSVTLPSSAPATVLPSVVATDRKAQR